MQAKFKNIAIALNVVAIIGLLCILSDEGFPSSGERFFWVFLVFLSTPLANLYVFFGENFSIRWFGFPDQEECELRRAVRKAELKKKLNEMNQ